MHWPDIVLLGLIGLGVLAAVRSLWRRRGSGLLRLWRMPRSRRGRLLLWPE